MYNLVFDIVLTDGGSGYAVGDQLSIPAGALGSAHSGIVFTLQESDAINTYADNVGDLFADPDNGELETDQSNHDFWFDLYVLQGSAISRVPNVLNEKIEAYNSNNNGASWVSTNDYVNGLHLVEVYRNWNFAFGSSKNALPLEIGSMTIGAPGVPGWSSNGDHTEGTYTDVPISSDQEGGGATATVVVNSSGNLESVEITNGGFGYGENDNLGIDALDIGNGTDEVLDLPDDGTYIDKSNIAYLDVLVENNDIVSVTANVPGSIYHIHDELSFTVPIVGGGEDSFEFRLTADVLEPVLSATNPSDLVELHYIDININLDTATAGTGGKASVGVDENGVIFTATVTNAGSSYVQNDH